MDKLISEQALIDLVEIYFMARLEKKTTWGRNEIKEEWAKTKYEVLAEIIRRERAGVV